MITIWQRVIFAAIKRSDVENISNELCKPFKLSTSLFNYSTSASSKTQKAEILKVAIVGPPNVGKSTIINQIVGRRVFAMSKKVHTTKLCAKAVYNEGIKQIIFLDTPGLVSLQEFEKYNLHTSFLRGGEDAVLEADIIGVVHDLSNKYNRNNLDPKILRLLYLYKEKDSFLILNKIDTIKSKRLLLDVSNRITSGKLKTGPNVGNKSETMSEHDIQKAIEEKKKLQWEHFSDVFMISALLGDGINDLRDYLLNKTYPGEWIFPADTFTDKNPVNIIEEAVRSKLLENLPQEVPYNLDVQLEFLDMDSKDAISTVVLVKCNTEKILWLVKGIRGERIKMIAMQAEQDLADAFLSNVKLKLTLTVKEKGNEISSFG